MTLFIVAIAVTLLLSFLCSMLEACLLSLSNLDIARMSERWPLPAKIWKNFKGNIQKPLAVILIINTFAHTIGASVSGAQFNKLYGNHWLALFSIVFSLVMIQWAEILPKTLAVKHNKTFGGIIGIPFNLVVYLFHPVNLAIEWMNRPFQGKDKTAIDTATSDIRVLARTAFLENLISKEQEKLIARSVFMSTLTAWDVMIDNSDINILSTTMNLQEGLIAAHLQRHTRFPLTENGDIDKIIGYVNFKDIVGALQVSPSDPSLRGIMRPVLFVKDTIKLPELLSKLTRGYQHIAIVQNDSKKTIGLVTLEDIIENLVGELQDEYDTPPDFIVQLSENRFRAGGSATFRQLKARAFRDLNREDDISIDKWFKDELKGKLPEENSSKNIDNNHFIKVRRIVRGNIYDIIIERTPIQKNSSPA
jgi:putative hemolysin